VSQGHRAPALLVHGDNDRLVLPEHALNRAEGLAKPRKDHDVLILHGPEEDTGHTLEGIPMDTAHQVILQSVV
jgi:hypothetical protein